MLENESETKHGLLRKSVLDLDPELTPFNLGSLNDNLALPLLPAKAAATLAAAGLLSSVLYGVSPRDPFTYAIALTVFIAIAIFAWNTT